MLAIDIRLVPHYRRPRARTRASKHQTLCLLLATCALACAPKIYSSPPAVECPSSAQARPPKGELRDGLWLQINRGACHGTCPIYRVRLTLDGEVKFEPGGWTQAHATMHRTLSKTDRLALQTALDQLHALPSYNRPAFDVPSRHVIYRRDDTVYHYTHTRGDPCAPAHVAEIERDLEAALGVLAWAEYDPTWEGQGRGFTMEDHQEELLDELRELEENLERERIKNGLSEPEGTESPDHVEPDDSGSES